MRFGDYIREIRRELRWTQPEAAREIGIEQSYLSKLESGKSYPSEDVFSSLITAYKIDVSDVTEKLFPAELDQLREIAQVRASILKRENAYQHRMQHWLIAGLCALMIGGACLGAALLAEDTQTTKFLYKTEAEMEKARASASSDTIDDNALVPEQHAGEAHQGATRRIGEQYKSIEDYRGVVFFEAVPGGEQTWRFYGSAQETVRSPLRWFMIPAITLIMGALGCFFASYRSQ